MARSPQGDSVPRSRATSSRGKGSGQNSQSSEARRSQEGEFRGRPPPRALTIGPVRGLPEEDLPRARTNILCKSWGDPQEPQCRPPKTQKGRLPGRTGGPPLGGECEQQGPRGGKLIFFSPVSGLTKGVSTWRQDRTDTLLGLRAKSSTVDWEQGWRLRRSLRLPPEGGPALGTLCTPRVQSAGRGSRGPHSPPSNALFSYARARLGLSWGRAGAVANGLALVPSDSLGPKLPPGSSRKEAG